MPKWIMDKHETILNHTAPKTPSTPIPFDSCRPLVPRQVVSEDNTDYDLRVTRPTQSAWYDEASPA